MDRIDFTLAAFADEAASDLEGQIRAIKRNRLSHIEIRDIGKINCGNLTATEAKQIRKRLDEEGLKVRTFGSPFGKFPVEADFTAEGERFLRAAEAAQILGADKMRIFSFFRKEGMEEDAAREIALTRLRWMAEQAKGLLLCHENEKGIYGDGWEFCKIICREIPQIRAVFDPANFVQCGVDTLKAWEELKDFTEYLHLKDSLSSCVVVPCGEGEGNVPFILGDFVRRGGRFATLEPHLANFASKKYLEREEYKTCGFAYEDNDEAFDAAVAAVRKILDGINVSAQ
ncbi:MAG: sugar phosphate isomerase/epimerase [Clostridia bacterium]|nr:sugar phosphate isomerase/epimerase [Clostridia bacterium]